MNDWIIGGIAAVGMLAFYALLIRWMLRTRRPE